MKVLVILGSPRKGGNTEILADRVVEGMKDGSADVELIRLADYRISPCLACGGCEKTGCCVIQDDMQKLYPRIDSADRLILVSPIYFYGVTAFLKAFIDRCQALWSRKYLLRQPRQGGVPRIGYLVSAAATKGEKIFDGAILTAKYGLDAMDFKYGGALLVKGVDRKGAVNDMADELERARQFGRNIAEG
ncbi:MAG TPA: flavodoxin [Desulfobulbaceae bacterium]|nr:flavodoxin [Desulfobulbaceae bacterium]